MCAVHNREVRYACKFWLEHLKIGEHMKTEAHMGGNIKMDLKHRCNLTNNTGEGEGVGGISSTGVRNLNLQKSQVRKRWKIGFNQLSIYIHPFPPFSPQFFLLAPLQLCSQNYS